MPSSVKKGKKVQVTISAIAIERLDKLVEQKGISRAAVISLALEKLWKEENIVGR